MYYMNYRLQQFIVMIILTMIFSCITGFIIGYHYRNRNPPVFQHSSLLRCPAGTIPAIESSPFIGGWSPGRIPEIVCWERPL